MINFNKSGIQPRMMVKIQPAEVKEPEPEVDSKPAETTEAEENKSTENPKVAANYGDASTPQYLANMGIKVISHTPTAKPEETPNTEEAPNTEETPNTKEAEPTEDTIVTEKIETSENMLYKKKGDGEKKGWFSRLVGGVFGIIKRVTPPILSFAVDMIMDAFGIEDEISKYE